MSTTVAPLPIKIHGLPGGDDFCTYQVTESNAAVGLIPMLISSPSHNKNVELEDTICKSGCSNRLTRARANSLKQPVIVSCCLTRKFVESNNVKPLNTGES